MAPDCNSAGRGRMEQDRPGMRRPFLTKTVSISCVLARLFPCALASQRGFYAFFLAGLQVVGVALNLLDNVFLLHLAFEAAQCVFEGLTLLQPNFGQTDTPPSSSGRTRYLLQGFDSKSRAMLREAGKGLGGRVRTRKRKKDFVRKRQNSRRAWKAIMRGVLSPPRPTPSRPVGGEVV